jgi:hypothetical protein
LVAKPEAKRTLRRPRRRWVDIRMDLWEVEWCDVDWIDLAQDRNRWRAPVNSVLNLRVLWNAGKLSSGCTTGGLSISYQLYGAYAETSLVSIAAHVDGRVWPKQVVVEKKDKITKCIWEGNICMQTYNELYAFIGSSPSWEANWLSILDYWTTRLMKSREWAS